MPVLILIAALAADAGAWQTVYVATQTRAENGPELNEPALNLLDTLQAQHTEQLRADGKAVTGGPIDGGAPGETMTLLCAESRDAALALANADPKVQFGQATVSVRAWRVPAGTFDCK